MISEELSIEIEALRFTYAEAVTLLQEEPMTVRVATSPYTGRLAIYIAPYLQILQARRTLTRCFCFQAMTAPGSMSLLTSSSQPMKGTQSAHHTSASVR